MNEYHSKVHCVHGEHFWGRQKETTLTVKVGYTDKESTEEAFIRNCLVCDHMQVKGTDFILEFSHEE